MSKLIDRSDVVSLVSDGGYRDKLGVWHDEQPSREVYCQVKSVTQAEWHNANQDGIKANYVFVLFKYDYNGEELVEYKGDKYSVLRTYDTQDDEIELHTGTREGTR